MFVDIKNYSFIINFDTFKLSFEKFVKNDLNNFQ